jgi:hypothetical protein
MGNIEVTFDFEDYIIDQELFTKLKEEAFDRLKKTPNGLNSVVDDMDLETFRRTISQTLPAKTGNAAEAAVADPLGLDSAGGIQGIVFQMFKVEEGFDPAHKCIVPMTKLILVFGSVDIGGVTDTPLGTGLWTTNEVEDACLKTAKALQRSLSGQEVGY